MHFHQLKITLNKFKFNREAKMRFLHVSIILTMLLIPCIQSLLKNIVHVTTPLTMGVKQPSSFNQHHHHHVRLSPLLSTTATTTIDDAIGSANLDWPNLG